MTHHLQCAGRLAALAFLGVCPTAALADPLPSLQLAPEQTTVSGLSSGAFMAVQLQVVFSSRIAGAGIVAGGPYGCAEGSVWRALFVCMDQFMVDPSAEASLEQMEERSAGIDPLAGLAADRVYLFHGTWDDTVGRASMDALFATYGALGVADEQIRYVTDIEAGHGFLTEAGEVECRRSAPDYLNDCDIDQAGDILSWLYDPVAPATAPDPQRLLDFEQVLYTDGAIGMDETGYVYVPQSCAEGALCRLHIALHGCQQGREQMGEDYARLTGYNAWAEANGIVVLYPQAVVVPRPWYSAFGGNPKGCWDWWGYSGDDYLTRAAPQIAAIARMAQALGASLQP